MVGAREESPLVPLLGATAVALIAAAIVARCFANGAALELLHPGAQLLFSTLALAACAIAALRRGLEGRLLLGDEPRLLAAAGAVVAWLALGAARAPHADLAWRTTLEWSALLGLALAARDAARDAWLARALVGLIAASVALGAILGLQDDLVRFPHLQALWVTNDPRLMAELDLMPDDQRQGMFERILGGGATGPWLLPNLLACAIAMALPLVLLGLRQNDGKDRPRFAAGVFAASVMLLCLWRTRSKGGLLAALAGLALLGLLHLPARVRRVALLGLAGAGALGLVAGMMVWWRSPDVEGVGLSLQVRLEYWSAGLGMWSEAPLMGHGPNQFRELFGAFKSARAEEAIHAHNLAVQLLAELGLVGFGLLAALGTLLLLPGLRALEAEAPPPGGPAPSRAGEAALVLGQLTGWALVAAHGEELVQATGLSALPGWALLLLCLAALPALAWLLRPARQDPLLPAAALAGAGAFLADGLTDFGLHYPGTLCLALLLLALAPRLAGAAPPPPAAPRAGIALGGGLLLLALLVLFGVTRPALEADALREAARGAHIEAAGSRRRADFEAAAELFAEATDAWPAHADTWRERAAVEGQLDLDRARASLQEAIARNPRSAASWAELAAVESARGAHPAAFEALDRAIERHPHHPGYLLQAAEVRRAAFERLPPDEQVRRAEETLRLCDRAAEASRTTRLVLRKLSRAQLKEVLALRSWAVDTLAHPQKPR